MTVFALNSIPVIVDRKIVINGEARLARLIRFDSEEGLTTTRLAELLNVAESTIRHHIKKQAVCARTLSAHIKHTLKNSNIIPIKSHGGLFLSREGIEVLVKVINTEEAWEVYRQLWNDARELAALKPILAELQAKHDATLAEFNRVSAERDRYESERDSVAQHAEELASINLKLLETLKTKDRQLTESKARFKASVDFIETKGKGKKKYRHCVAEFEFAGVNIFECHQYSVTVRKLQLEEMDDRQRNSHAIQKSVTTAYGIAKLVQQRLKGISSLNPEINKKADSFCDAGRDLVEAILPPTGSVFCLKAGEPIAYLN